MLNQTHTFYLEKTIEVETKITIEKEGDNYLAYVYDELSQDTREIGCWVEDGGLMADECDTEEEYDCVIQCFTEYMKANGGVIYARKCDKCGQGMNEGYCVEGGEEYYCTPKCLHEVYTPMEWQNMVSDSGDSYWTEWDDEHAYILFDNQLITI